MSMSVIDAIGSYFKKYGDTLTEADKTARWNIEGDSHEPLSVKGLESGGEDLNAGIFSTNEGHIPAQLIAQGMAYDATQAATRLSRIYSMGRGDYYSQSGSDTSLRGSYLSMQNAMFSSIVNLSENSQKTSADQA